MCTCTKPSAQNTLKKPSSTTNIVPRHPSAIENRNDIIRILADVLEIQKTRIVVILAREERKREVGGVHVSQRMGVCIPTAETEIEAADASPVIVYDDKL